MGCAGGENSTNGSVRAAVDGFITRTLAAAMSCVQQQVQIRQSCGTMPGADPSEITHNSIPHEPAARTMFAFPDRLAETVRHLPRETHMPTTSGRYH